MSSLDALPFPVCAHIFLFMPAGRPSLYSPEMVRKICTRLAAGESLRSVCRDDEMPEMGTIYDWLRAHPEFQQQYARATEDRADAIFEEMFEIADDGSNDWIEADGRDIVNHEYVTRSKLRIDTRKWALARMNPRKYGEKTTTALVGPDGGPIELDVKMSPKEASEAFKRMAEGE